MSEENKIVDLYGCRTEYSYCTCTDECSCYRNSGTDYRDLVATFSSFKLAEKYVKASELKTLPHGSGYRFRKESLLRHHTEVCIDSHDVIDVPHDPVI